MRDRFFAILTASAPFFAIDCDRPFPAARRAHADDLHIDAPIPHSDASGSLDTNTPLVIGGYDFRRLFVSGERSGLAASRANRSDLSRSIFLRSAICSFSCSVNGVSDGRNALLASFFGLPMI
jgi:hypothetical protein